MNTKTAILLVLLVALICLLAGMHIEYKHIEKNKPEPAIDTTSKTDTVYKDKPVPVEVIPDGYELTPIGLVSQLQDSLAQKPKLVTLHDTTYIAVPMSNYHFTDTTTYDMMVRGYDVSLLYHKSFQETKYITKTIPVPEYREYGLLIYPKVSTFGMKGILGATAGIGADIRLGDKGIFYVSPEIDYGVLWTEQGMSHGIYAGATVRANIIRIK